MTNRLVTPDGSPVAVYLSLPLEPEFTPILSAIPEGASVLDLGCGVGRLANHLAEKGHQVVGVDESLEMLSHLHARVTGIHRKIEGLRLQTRFDVVVLASHFINVPEPDQRRALLETAAHHLDRAGSLFIERYDPNWNLEPGVRESQVGPVRLRFEILEGDRSGFTGRVEYSIGEEIWVQEFRARVIDDEELSTALQEVGLTVARHMDDRGWWLEAVHGSSYS